VILFEKIWGKFLVTDRGNRLLKSFGKFEIESAANSDSKFRFVDLEFIPIFFGDFFDFSSQIVGSVWDNAQKKENRRICVSFPRGDEQWSKMLWFLDKIFKYRLACSRLNFLFIFLRFEHKGKSWLFEIIEWVQIAAF